MLTIYKKIRHILKLFLQKLLVNRKDLFISYLSTNKNVFGVPIINQSTQLVGEGTICFEKQVQLGYYPSPFFYSGYMYLEARNSDAIIKIGNNTMINNNIVIIAESGMIEIGDNCLIGANVEIINSDFHHIHPNKRNNGTHKSKSIHIGNNVFIGSNVKIMKGVTIGDNAVIANSSVVFEDVKENVIVKGNPAIEVNKINL